MKVFIGWSGETSQKVAALLQSWLPTVNPNIETFTEFNYINAETLNAVDNFPPLDCALLCVTPDCARSPWLTFEAGALMGMNVKRLYLILFGTPSLSLSAPLLTLGNVRFDRAGIRNVTWELNCLCGNDALPEKELDRLFNGLYPWLEENVENLLRDLPAPEEEPDASNANLQLEMRALNRKLDTLLSRLPGRL